MFLTTIATGWEIGCFRAQMQLAQKNLAEANRIVGANITVGAMLLDQEQLSVGYEWNSSTRQVNTFLACVAETARPLPKAFRSLGCVSHIHGAAPVHAAVQRPLRKGRQSLERGGRQRDGGDFPRDCD